MYGMVKIVIPNCISANASFSFFNRKMGFFFHPTDIPQYLLASFSYSHRQRKISIFYVHKNILVHKYYSFQNTIESQRVLKD